MIQKLLVFTEGSPEIGLGHLVECESITHLWKEKESIHEFLFTVPDDPGAIQFLNSRKILYRVNEKENRLSSYFIGMFDAFLVNYKNVEYDFLCYLDGFKKFLIVVDELGNKEIVADILINFSINKNRHHYQFPNRLPKLFFGPQFFPASQAIRDVLKKKPVKKENLIVVSLGGYDHSGIIYNVIDVLKEFPEYKKEIILGPGFEKKPDFKKLVSSLDGTFQFSENVSDLPIRILKAKILINSGGDTLYEASILGTPTLVIGEEPHEIEQGDIFADLGFAINIPNGKNAKKEEIYSSIKNMLEVEWCFPNKFSDDLPHDLSSVFD